MDFYEVTRNFANSQLRNFAIPVCNSVVKQMVKQLSFASLSFSYQGSLYLTVIQWLFNGYSVVRRWLFLL